MNSFRPLVLLLCLTTCSATNAASLSYTRTADAFAIFLDGEQHNGAFDTFGFWVRPNAPAVFTNFSGLLGGPPRPPGQPFTYHNGLLNADPLDDPNSIGLAMLGLIRTPTELSFAASRLGGTITTATQPNGDLFLGNVNMPGAGASANVTVQLYRAGDLVQELTATIPVPEPTSMALAGIALAGMIAVSHRR
jgi:hypothetical protein